jgi:hypothetical protein
MNFLYLSVFSMPFWISSGVSTIFPGGVENALLAVAAHGADGDRAKARIMI